jgi:RHS repeat-associated protein
MKIINILLFSICLTCISPILYGQDLPALPAGSDNSVNIPGPADESLVQGNGTRPSQNHTGALVNTFTGDAEATSTDFEYTRPGFPMEYERYFHNGITSPFGELGQGWMSNYDICLFVPMPNSNGNHALLVMPNQVWSYSTNDGGNTYVTPPGIFDQLQVVANSSPVSYTLTTSSGVTFIFSVLPGGEPNIARLVEMDDLNGNQVKLSYQTCLFFTESVNLQIYGAVDGNLEGNFGFNSSYQTLRLSNVTGNNNNWSINFNYYENSNSSTSQSYTTSPWDGSLAYELYFVNSAQYTNPNRLQSVTNSAGDLLTFSFDGSQSGPITSVSRSPSGLNASYQYYNYVDSSTAIPTRPVVTLQQIVDPLAPVGSRNLTYVSESNSNSINNPVRQIKNALGQVMYSYNYSNDSSGNVLTSTSGPNGLIETDVYNSSGLWTQKRFVIDGDPYTENYTWDSNLQLVYLIDGNGHPTTIVYDSLGNMTYKQDAENDSVSIVYNNISRPVTSIDENGNKTTYSYDNYGNLKTEYQPGRTTHYTYFPNGLKNTVTDSLGHTTTYNYDSNGNLTSVQEPSVNGQPGVINSSTYDSNGRNLIVSKTLASNTSISSTIKYSYNSINFLQTVTYPDKTTESYTYDNDGDNISFTDRNETETTYSYDLADRLTDIYQGKASSYPGNIRHTYSQLDALGNIKSIIDNKYQKTTFVYNEQNKVRGSLDSLGKGYSNTYDGALNLLTSKDTRGVSRTMVYYRNNRVKSIQFSNGTPSIAYVYDPNGNRLSMTDGVGMKTYTYDPLNNLETVSDISRNFNLGYTYDAVGNRTSMQNNKVSGTTYYYYYPNNLLKSTVDPDGMGTTFTYDALNNPQNVAYPNGVTAVYGFDYTNHTNRLLSLQNLNSHGEGLLNFSYTYDNAGNVMEVKDFTGPTTYSYDNLYQLTGTTHLNSQGGAMYSFGYVYDGVGNRTLVTENSQNQNTSTYNSGNELASDTVNGGYSYDNAGNMVSKGTTSYTWDGLDRLVKISNGPSGPISYVYDGDDHRIQKITSNGTINYFYDLNSVIAETDGNGKILKSYTAAISVKDKQGNKFFYICNGHGDVAGIVDAKQNLVQNYVYQDFGKAVGIQVDPNNSRYAGLSVYSDDDAGMEYMWHRWYDPNSGRFVSRDPLLFMGGFNFYNYCSNNPLRLVDPKGTQIELLLLPIIAGALNGISTAIENGVTDPTQILHYALIGAGAGVAVDAVAVLALGVGLQALSIAILSGVTAGLVNAGEQWAINGHFNQINWGQAFAAGAVSGSTVFGGLTVGASFGLTGEVAEHVMTVTASTMEALVETAKLQWQTNTTSNSLP